MLKNIVRSILNCFHLDVTKNLHYDRLTKEIIKKALTSNSNTIDIGCHKGEILCELHKQAPNGTHFGFEPIPELYEKLKKDFENKAQIFPYALAETNGTTTFHYVKNAPAYSGIKKRKYNIEHPNIEKIEVTLKKLDDVIPSTTKINFIKIDVEGAELGVLKGAEQLLKRNKPIVIFECGLGASEYYNTQAKDVFDFLNLQIGLKIYTLESWLSKNTSLSENEFITCFNTNSEYYFIADAL
jgi:FkbM family methyltransferase